MKKSELIFTAVSLPVDYLMLILAGLAAWALRTSSLVAQWRPVLFSLNLPFERYLGLISLIGIFWIAIFALVGLYDVKRSARPWQDFVKIVIGTSAGLMSVIVYIFVQRQFFDSRFLILAGWVLAIIFLSWGRLILSVVKKYIVSHYGFGAYNVLVIGGDGVSEEIIQEIKERPSLGYRLARHFRDLDIKEIEKTAQEWAFDEIILASSDFKREDVLWLIDWCEEKRLNFKFVPNLFQTLTSHIDFDTLGTVPLIELKRTALDGWGRIIKRLMDIFGAIAGIVIFSPAMAVVAILIKLESPGPVVYKNERVGQKGIFKAYKFRSMKIEYCTGGEYDKTGEASRLEDELVVSANKRRGPVFKVADDPRRTKLGNFLERTSLDELPQFFNVLLGNMSLVGPRPHIPKEVAKYEKWHKKVFNIKPGITGLAQISGRSELDFDEEVKLDTYYIENWSLGLDIKILLKTPWVAWFKRART